MVLSLECIKSCISLLLIPLVFLVGAYFSLRLRWPQFLQLGLGLKSIFKKEKAETKSSVSSFSALAAVLGGNLGTGNIAGIAVAVSLGGPGTLFWMWVMASFGAVVKFASCYLGVKNRIKSKEHGWLGGPMYYLEQCLKAPMMAKIYCLLVILGALTVGNLVQVNSIALPVNQAGFSAGFIGIAMAVAVGLVLLGDVKIFATISSLIVPFMAVIYLGACLTILFIFRAELSSTIMLIFKSAFNIPSVFTGVVGFTILDAIRVGFDRGLFATDAGVGLAAILHSQVDEKDDSSGNYSELGFTQGLITMVAPFIVMVICTVTGMALLITGAWQVDGVQSTNMCIKAFELGIFPGAGKIVIFTLLLFSFTTILTWFHCAQRAVLFLSKENRWVDNLFKIFFISVIPCGAFSSVSFVWLVADISLNLMLLVNLWGIVLLSREVITDMKKKIKKIAIKGFFS